MFQLTKKTAQQHFDTPFDRMRRVKKIVLNDDSNYNESNTSNNGNGASTSTPIHNGRMQAPNNLTPIAANCNVTVRRHSLRRSKKSEIEYETPEKKDKKNKENENNEEMDVKDITYLKVIVEGGEGMR